MIAMKDVHVTMHYDVRRKEARLVVSVTDGNDVLLKIVDTDEAATLWEKLTGEKLTNN